MNDPDRLPKRKQSIPFLSLPAVKTALLIIIGIIAGRYIPIASYYRLLSCLFLLLSTILYSFCFHQRCWPRDAMLALAIVIAASLRYTATAEIFPPNHIIHFAGKHREKIAVMGTVSSLPSLTNKHLEFRLHCETFSADSIARRVQGTALVRWYKPALTIHYGDRLRLYGRLRRPAAVRNPGEFNYRKYLYAQDIHGLISISDSTHVQIIASNNESLRPGYLLARIRHWCHYAINASFAGQERALLKGLLLGVRSEIDPNLRKAFSAAGVMHVLAVSGLHVGFVIMLLHWIFQLLWIPYRWNWILTMIALFFYAALIGFKPPVVRATLLAELFLFGSLLQQPVIPANVLSGAAIIMLLARPLDLFESSFQLSFAAVISIMFLYRRIQQGVRSWGWLKRAGKIKLLDYFLQIFEVSAAASIGTLPFIVYYFEKFPTLTLLINIPIIPLAGAIVAMGFTHLAAFELWPGSLMVIDRLLHWLLHGMVLIVTAVNRLKWASIDVFGISGWEVAGIVLFIWLVLHIHIRWCRILVTTGLLLVINFHVWNKAIPSEPKLKIAFLDVGQGDSAYLRFPDGKHMLIDAGPKKEGLDAGERYVIPYLQRHGVDTLQALLVSHVDGDHLGGVPAVLRSLPVKQVYDNGDTVNTPVYHEYRRLLDSLGIEHTTLKLGDHIPGFEPCGIFVLNPDPDDYYANHNDQSIVLKIVWDSVSVLFPGDIEKSVERELVYFDSLLKSNILKVAHHGSRTSSTLSFIQTVNPDIAVISVGEINNFGHPSPHVLACLDSLGIHIDRTDLQGAIIYETDGYGIVKRR